MLDLQELERLGEMAGMRPHTSHEAERDAADAARHMASYDLPRVKSVQERIFEAVAAGGGKWVKRAEIAERMGVVKASWLNRHLAEMVSRGILRCERTTLANKSKMYWYIINPAGKAS